MRCSFILLLFVCSAAIAQSVHRDSTTLVAGIQANYGSILAHVDVPADIAKARPTGVQFQFSRIRFTRKSWESCNCYSQNGLALSYYDLNNAEKLGHAISLMLFVEPRLVSTRHYNLNVRIGEGLTYVTRRYHPVQNPDNILVATRLNGMLLLQLTHQFELSNSWNIKLATSYHHISNGGFKQPNKGLNFPAFSFGAEYVINRRPFPRHESAGAFDRRLHYYGGLFLSSRPVSDSVDTRKPIFGIHAGIMKNLARRNAVGIAFEISHDESLKAKQEFSPDVHGHRVASALVRHHLLFGKFDFSQALGAYLFKEYPTSQPVFQRYILEYKIFPNVSAGFSIKTHLYTAEQMDVRLTVKL